MFLARINFHMTNSGLVVSVALFLVMFGNISFFKNVAEIYPPSLGNIALLGSVAVALASFITLVLSLVTFKKATKPVLILILLVSSLTSYFMDSYNAVIDATMVQNIMQTDVNESLDLFTFKLVWYFLLLGLLPSVVIYKIPVQQTSLQAELVSKLKVVAVSIFIILAIILAFSKFYSSLLREHKSLRLYTNPTYYVYSIGKYLNETSQSGGKVLHAIGTDAKIPATDIDKELVILVVGEAARADRFSLNGYSRETNPLVKKEEVVSFSNMRSCGTSTAVSVPCMFSIFGKDNYSDSKAKSTQNLIHVLQHAGVNVLWRDNNSDSKGVAVGVPYQDFKTPANNPVCDIECRDEGMLSGLQEYIAGKKDGDILIVLHQMGNHGPAYYKRYPPAFERFTPVCKSNQLETCSREEISNAYDNAILYTDYFLSKVIALLKQNSAQFETVMIYMSDHGESLGEKGLYLHGMPYFMAPDEQTHVGSVMWFGENYHVDRNAVKAKSGNEYSQDNLFHTMLGLFEVGTSVYDVKKDILNYHPAP